MNKLLLVIAAALLAGCVEQPISSESKVMHVTLVGFYPPKHVYADLQDDATGTVYGRAYVSKHCNSWRTTANLGKKMQVVRTVRTYKDGTKRTDFSNLKEQLCK